MWTLITQLIAFSYIFLHAKGFLHHNVRWRFTKSISVKFNLKPLKTATSFETPSDVTKFRAKKSLLSSEVVINELKEYLSVNRKFQDTIEESLVFAKTSASSTLNPLQFQILEWPETIDDYFKYLTEFATWAPEQTGNPAFAIPGGNDGYQEVYVRLCHFYYLIDVCTGDQGPVENQEFFQRWLIRYCRAWGSFLDSERSFSDEKLQSFIKNAPKYRVTDSMIPDSDDPSVFIPNNPSGWLTFNQFFARQLNLGLRPISKISDNSVVTAPADDTFRQKFKINGNSEIPEIRLKGTHKVGNIGDLIKGSGFEDSFRNGQFVHYFLSPYSYHRFHAPVSGKVAYVDALQELVYLDVKIDRETGQFDAPDNSDDGYEFQQARGIIIIDTKDSPDGDVGLVAILPIGMCQVSSVQMTATKGTYLQKGDEFGYFAFGGSDIIVLFEEKAEASIDVGTHYRHYGTPIATVKAQK